METTAPASSATPSAYFWRWLAALTVIGNIALNYWANTHPFNGQTMGTVSAKYPTLLTPAGYAFSIWGLIFLALTAYVIWQLLPAQRDNPLPDAVAQPLTLASVATAAWVLLFAYELVEVSVLVMLLILASLIVGFGRVRRFVRAGRTPRWTIVPFALYLGWISVASVINLTIGLRELGWQPAANVSVLLTLVLLAVVVALGLIISGAFHSVVYPLVVAWALVAIWVAQRGGAYPELAWAALVGAVIAVLGGVALGLRKPRPVVAE
ncbi:tryptophan-rich sensory protein [Hymenobacter fastidiosus]|uniref:Tryptophan-rich sensory protein n=1 Tax=Hymenobacter fastidiosus TaxID=486264 RepID=A0ABP7RRB0_9BACT